MRKSHPEKKKKDSTARPVIRSRNVPVIKRLHAVRSSAPNVIGDDKKKGKKMARQRPHRNRYKANTNAMQMQMISKSQII
jgi:hypothetical protein